MLLAATIAIVLLPAMGFAGLATFRGRLGEKAGPIAAGTIGLCAVLALVVLAATFRAGGGTVVHSTFTWADAGTRPLDFGILVDGLSAVMLVMVSIVASMVFTYAIGYMHGDKRYGWFFAVLSLFTMSMFGLVTSSNLLQILVFWEIMGLCSYLLIGFWYEREESRRACIKAFIATRIGDMGFLSGVILLFIRFNTLDLPKLFEHVEAGGADRIFLTIATLMLFFGAVGKSAQFPLYFWLPDAMAGPTPVSGLLHSATMVAAGVFLVARMFPVFEVAHYALPLVAGAGMFSALFAALLALTETDIKRTLAYSTMSQLGYMMGALGVGALAPAVFHLVTHGFFKSLLFLAAGSVIHGSGTQDIREMGGLMKSMRTTALTFLVGALALSGLPPLAGFFSKDAILGAMWFSQKVPVVESKLLFVVGLATAVLTAFYMFRVYFAVFAGEPKGKAHESPAIMTVPLRVLAGITIVGGLMNLPVGFAALTHLVAPEEKEHLVWWLLALSIAAATIGVWVAWEQHRNRLAAIYGLDRYVLYSDYGLLGRAYVRIFVRPVFALSELLRDLNYDRVFSAAIVQPVINASTRLRGFNIDRVFQEVFVTPVFRLSDTLRKWDIDVIYDVLFIRVSGWSAERLRWFDEHVVDATANLLGTVGLKVAKGFDFVDLRAFNRSVDFVGDATVVLGKSLRRMQTGLVSNYALFMLMFGIIIFYMVRWLAR
jgi:NADH-quinone oxidoreductase subunit L